MTLMSWESLVSRILRPFESVGAVGNGNVYQINAST